MPNMPHVLPIVKRGVATLPMVIMLMACATVPAYEPMAPVPNPETRGLRPFDLDTRACEHACLENFHRNDDVVRPICHNRCYQEVNAINAAADRSHQQEAAQDVAIQAPPAPAPTRPPATSAPPTGASGEDGGVPAQPAPVKDQLDPSVAACVAIVYAADNARDQTVVADARRAFSGRSDVCVHPPQDTLVVHPPGVGICRNLFGHLNQGVPEFGPRDVLHDEEVDHSLTFLGHVATCATSRSVRESDRARMQKFHHCDAPIRREDTAWCPREYIAVSTKIGCAPNSQRGRQCDDKSCQQADAGVDECRARLRALTPP